MEATAPDDTFFDLVMDGTIELTNTNYIRFIRLDRSSAPILESTVASRVYDMIRENGMQEHMRVATGLHYDERCYPDTMRIDDRIVFLLGVEGATTEGKRTWESMVDSWSAFYSEDPMLSVYASC